MWKTIKDSQYFLLFTKGNGYEIYVTDFVNVWHELYDEKAFIAQLKESNEGLELQNDNEFVHKGIHLLLNLDQLKKLSIEKQENGKSLFINMTISYGFPFHLTCKLLKGPEELFFQKITQPFLKTIGDLRASQSELRRLLIVKDREIEEYKCEGGEIVLRHLKTKTFNDQEHMKTHAAYEEHFGEFDTLKTVIEKTVDIPRQNNVKQEPIVTENPGPELNVKIEPEIKTEAATIKTEPTTEVIKEPSVSLISTSMSCQQDVKKETIRAHVPRKRSKFNF